MQMQAGIDPTTALQRSMTTVIKFYPSIRSAMFAVNTQGDHGMLKEVLNTGILLPPQPMHLFFMSILF
jgi:hypothetical protein